MEGKEVRFGIADSALFATITTDASCGAVNAMHDSFMPLGGLVPLVNMQLGEVIFGGVGAGLYGMLMFAILAVFIAGLMVGRTPEYLGKKIEAFEMKMAMLLVADSARQHSGASPARRSSVTVGDGSIAESPGRTASPRSSTRSRRRRRQQRLGASAGLTAQHALLQHRRGGLAMLIGRFLMIVPLLAHRRLAGAQEARAGERWARSRRTGRCSSGCWSA